MATTGFWPIKSDLKATVDYARNPEKTTLPDGLFDTLHYAGNEDKVRQGGESVAFVHGINCPAKTAYEHMVVTKQHYGKLGGILGFHGYQSFTAGEVTPEEAHEIGMETAKEMWGRDYEVVVATHLNTENIHNHFVVNSVSFTTGRKFENHISDRLHLREISDRICEERGKSVLKNSRFYTRGQKKEYWVHKSGRMTHRDMLRRDIDRCIAMSTNMKAFEYNLTAMGYRFVYDPKRRYKKIIAEGWQRPVRISSLGPDYSEESIRGRIMETRFNMPYDLPPYQPRSLPLLRQEKYFYHAYNHDLVTIYFELAVALLQLMVELLKFGDSVIGLPISPAMREELKNVKEYVEDYRFLRDNGIATVGDLESFITDKADAVSHLEGERQLVRNQIRRPKSEETRQEDKERAKAITREITPIRQELLVARRIKEKYPKLKRSMDIEFAMEAQLRDKDLHKNNYRERNDDAR